MREQWVALAEDGAEFSISIRIESGLLLRADWVSNADEHYQGYVESPFKVMENIDAEFKDRAVRALINLCCETMRRQGFKVRNAKRLDRL